MSKLIPFLFAGVGASSVSVGGVFMLKKTGGGGAGGSVQTDQNQQPSQSTTQLTFYEDVNAFKNAKGDKCVHELFGSDLDTGSSNGSTELSSSTPSDADTYFGTNPSNDAEGTNTTGCLIINGKKATKESKGKGAFTWSGSFKNQKKGFIIFGVAKTNDTSKKLDLTGLTYLLEEDANSKWTIKYHKEVTNGKDISTSDNDLDSKLPKAGTDIKKDLSVDESHKTYWGFISGQTDLNNICGSTDCPDSDPKPTPQPYQWKWNGQKSGGAQSISSGCEKLDWWKKIFDGTSFEFKDKLNDFNGKGEKQQVSNAS